MYYPQLTSYLQLTNIPTTPQLPFLDHLFGKINAHIALQGRVLLLTLTKKSSEEITNFLVTQGYKAYYLHSEIDTLQRREIIKKLRTGQIDILVGINLLREGIDLPEVSLIALLDADKEWFLRSTTALIQNIGRAARNPRGEVILYADSFTESMLDALHETYRRRAKQHTFNQKHGITPSLALSNVKELSTVKTDEDLSQTFHALTKNTNKRLKRMTQKEKNLILTDLKAQLDEAITAWEFEKAAVLRDQIKGLTEWITNNE